MIDIAKLWPLILVLGFPAFGMWVKKNMLSDYAKKSDFDNLKENFGNHVAAQKEEGTKLWEQLDQIKTLLNQLNGLLARIDERTQHHEKE